ncbi:MAG: peroxiredoxin [Lapillicoccus sp.]
MGDGALTATLDDAQSRRVRVLVGGRIPGLRLPDHAGVSTSLSSADVWTVLYAFPGAYAPSPGAYPPGRGEIPSAAGCTLEATTYSSHHREFVAAGARVLGVSTQRPDQLAAFRAHARLPFGLLSDQDGRLAVALRLPTFLVAGTARLKRVTLLVDPGGVVQAVQARILDPAASVMDMLAEALARVTAVPA